MHEKMHYLCMESRVRTQLVIGCTGYKGPLSTASEVLLSILWLGWLVLPAKWVLFEALVPDAGGDSPRHEISVILGPVPHKVTETKLPCLQREKGVQIGLK